MEQMNYAPENFWYSVPILYHDVLNPQARSCYMLCKMFDINVELRSIRGTQSYNCNETKPSGNTPILHDGCYILNEGHTIMMYLCDKYSSSFYPNLCPSDYSLRLEMLNMLFFEASNLFPIYSYVMSSNVLKKCPNMDLDYHRERLYETYNTLNFILESHTFMVGNCLTIADFSIITTVSSLDLIYPISQSEWPNLHRWFENLKNMDSYFINQEGLHIQNRILLSSKSKADSDPTLSQCSRCNGNNVVFPAPQKRKQNVKDFKDCRSNRGPISNPEILRENISNNGICEEIKSSRLPPSKSNPSVKSNRSDKNIHLKTHDKRIVADSETGDIASKPILKRPEREKQCCNCNRSNFKTHENELAKFGSEAKEDPQKACQKTLCNQKKYSNIKFVEFQCITDEGGSKCCILRVPSIDHLPAKNQCPRCVASMQNKIHTYKKNSEGVLRGFKSCLCLEHHKKCEITRHSSQRMEQMAEKRPICVRETNCCDEDFNSQSPHVAEFNCDKECCDNNDDQASLCHEDEDHTDYSDVDDNEDNSSTSICDKEDSDIFPEESLCGSENEDYREPDLNNYRICRCANRSSMTIYSSASNPKKSVIMCSGEKPGNTNEVSCDGSNRENEESFYCVKQFDQTSYIIFKSHDVNKSHDNSCDNQFIEDGNCAKNCQRTELGEKETSHQCANNILEEPSAVINEESFICHCDKKDNSFIRCKCYKDENGKDRHEDSCSTNDLKLHSDDVPATSSKVQSCASRRGDNTSPRRPSQIEKPYRPDECTCCSQEIRDAKECTTTSTYSKPSVLTNIVLEYNPSRSIKKPRTLPVFTKSSDTNVKEACKGSKVMGCGTVDKYRVDCPNTCRNMDKNLNIESEDIADGIKCKASKPETNLEKGIIMKASPTQERTLARSKSTGNDAKFKATLGTEMTSSEAENSIEQSMTNKDLDNKKEPRIAEKKNREVQNAESKNNEGKASKRTPYKLSRNIVIPSNQTYGKDNNKSSMPIPDREEDGRPPKESLCDDQKKNVEGQTKDNAKIETLKTKTDKLSDKCSRHAEKADSLSTKNKVTGNSMKEKKILTPKYRNIPKTSSENKQSNERAINNNTKEAVVTKAPNVHRQTPKKLPGSVCDKPCIDEIASVECKNSAISQKTANKESRNADKHSKCGKSTSTDITYTAR